MSQAIKIELQYSYYYPAPSYLGHLNQAQKEGKDWMAYEHFQDIELIERYKKIFLNFGQLQDFIFQVTGIPAAQQHLSRKDGHPMHAPAATSLCDLGLQEGDTVILQTYHPSGPFDYREVHSTAQKEAFVAAYPPPAHMDDLDTLDKQVKWAEWESNTADQNIYTGAGLLADGYGAYPIAPQFFNPANPATPVAPIAVTKVIAWNGLPGLLRNEKNYTDVYKLADEVIKHGERTNQTEYCEWKTFYADEAQNKIDKVVFTCEGPEYWQQLFNIDPEKCVALYRELTGIASICKEDLLAKEDIYLAEQSVDDPPFVRKGKYNFYNKYNTELGIVHLNQRNNYLSAELNIASMATQVQQEVDAQGNLTVLQKALPLILAGSYGSPGRNSDPTIGFICNWVARHPLGLRLTIAPPVALYFGMLNTTGWRVPEGAGEIDEWVKCVRGNPEKGQVLRYEIAVPERLKGRYFVNDLTIGGQAIEYGGQIARCMTVQLTGLASAFPAEVPAQAPPVRPRHVIAASFGKVDPISNQAFKNLTLQNGPVATAGMHTHVSKRNSVRFPEANSNPPPDSPAQALQKMAQLEHETILDIDDIQGDPVLGFNTSNSIILLLDIADNADCKTWLRDCILPRITSTREVLKRREQRRQHHHHLQQVKACPVSQAGSDDISSAPRYTYLNVSFGSEGLALLTSQAEVQQFYALGNAEAYVLGMPKRSTLLGDPEVGSRQAGARDQWHFGGERTPHLMLQIQGDSMADCEALAQEILQAGGNAISLVFRDVGQRREGKHEKAKEQFGFHDGISNPALRGMYHTDGGDQTRQRAYISRRDIAPTDPRWNFFAQPGAELIWPGEFVLGYPKQRNIQGASQPQAYYLPDTDDFIGPKWAKNGSFVIYRRLNQNVASFWQHAQATADSFNAQYTAQNAPANWTAEKAAAHFVGRWPSGCPLMLSPDQDVLAWGQNKMTQNAFMYAVDTPPFIAAKTGEPVPGVTTIAADNIGLRCPMGAHVRKVNPRDQGTDFGPNEDTLKHRIMRRGTPFGPFVAEKDKFKDDGQERGLQFIAYAANIDMQFEFLLRHWVNFDQQPVAMTGGFAHDMVLGQAAQNDYERQLTSLSLNQDGVPATATSPRTRERWVYASGGGYFFMPGIAAIREKLC